MRKFTKKILASMSIKVLNKYKPLIIAVTGSVGKTSAKECIYAAISDSYKTRRNIKNYNNEFGVPFTILDTDSPGKNIFKWIWLFYKASLMIKDWVDYPSVLILEMGIDRPGDMDYLVDLAKPNVAMLTAIGQSHIKYFGSEQAILNEKKKIFKDLGNNGVAILNYDNEKLRDLIPELHSKLITYGLHPGAEVRAELVSSSFGQQDDHGTSFILVYGNHRHPVFLKGSLGSGHVLSYLAGVSAALAIGISIDEAVGNLSNYSAQPGRMRILSGKSDSIIIDDTYNSSPQAVRMALNELGSVPNRKKILFLGDMLELGEFSHKEHVNLIREIMQVKPAKVILVGQEMSALGLEMLRSGYSKENLKYFKNTSDALKNIGDMIEPGALYFIKGSQGMRMESLVKELLHDKKAAKKLLVRQNKEWLKQPV